MKVDVTLDLARERESGQILFCATFAADNDPIAICSAPISENGNARLSAA